MEVFPQLAVERFEQLKPGELFLVDMLDTKMVAMKAVDDQQDGDTLMVLLGPSYPRDWRPGYLVPWQGVTVVSFGTRFLLELPHTPDGWSANPPPPEMLALVKTNEEIFLRGYFQQGPSRFADCLVGIKDGNVVYNRRLSMPMYASQWAMSVKDPYGLRRPILEIHQPRD
jgi:hypothetical protein